MSSYYVVIQRILILGTLNFSLLRILILFFIHNDISNTFRLIHFEAYTLYELINPPPTVNT